MRWSYSSSLICFGLFALACGDDAREPLSTETAGFSVALSFSESDVTAVRFDVMAASDDCTATAIASETVALGDAKTAPVAGHVFASALITIEPGSYRVCANPLAGSVPSAECSVVSALADVVAEQTSEVMLVSQCTGDPSGGLAPVVSLNKPPRINQITANPASRITTCEVLKLAVSAADPEGDALSYAWNIVEGASTAHLDGTDDQARFSGPEGDYLIGVTVSDVHGGQATLSFPVSVASATCVVPQNVHDIMLAKCSPCHTTNPNPSAGLSMLTPELAYQNLVLHSVSSSACSSRTRVVPGDASASYIIAKLRGLPGICGQQMPRGRPPLPEEEINAFEAWINDLPLP